jgi:hypothetical protein
MLAAMTTLARLQACYSHQCNGEWGHSSGVNIQSCDNPGWWIKINLRGTPLQNQTFTEIAEGVDSQRFSPGSPWLNCHTQNVMGLGTKQNWSVSLKYFSRGLKKTAADLR